MALFFNGVELPFDMLDADDNKKVVDAVTIAAEKAKALTGETSHEAIASLCHIVFECFNAIFGEGTDKKLFGDKTNMRVALDAFYALVKEKERQESEFSNATNDLLNKYSPSRVKR